MLADVIRGWSFTKPKGCYWDISLSGIVCSRGLFMPRTKVILGEREMSRTQ